MIPAPMTRGTASATVNVDIAEAATATGLVGTMINAMMTGVMMTGVMMTAVMRTGGTKVDDGEVGWGKDAQK